MIPPDDAGREYRQAVDSLIGAVEHEAKIANQLERAKHEVSNKREQLNTSVGKLIAREKRINLGPDGGK